MLPGDIFQSPVLFPREFSVPNCTTLAPAASAIACVPSVLSESTTTISLANETLARQSRRFAASFLTGTSTDNGAGASDRWFFGQRMLHGFTSFIATALAPTIAPSPMGKQEVRSQMSHDTSDHKNI